jgi:hypothetical protein
MITGGCLLLQHCVEALPDFRIVLNNTLRFCALLVAINLHQGALPDANHQMANAQVLE